MMVDVERIGRVMRYLTVGNNFVAKFLVPINFAIVTLTFLKVYNIALDRYQMGLLFCCAIGSALLIGIMYDRLGLYAIEMSFDGKRNSELRKLDEKLEWLIKKSDCDEMAR